MFKIISLVAFLLSTISVNAAEIDIDPHNHSLSYHDDFGATKVYQIGVGKAGTNVHGTFKVINKRLHPSWTPTPHMLRGRESFTVPPGPKNPLGAAKLYLSGPMPYIGIHGTNNETSIGRNVSHGCFRLHKADIIDLYRTVPVGTVVRVDQ